MANINTIIYKGVKYHIGDNILVGGSDVDLTGYATNAYVDEQIAGLSFDCDWDESRIAALESLVSQLNERIDNPSSGGFEKVVLTNDTVENSCSTTILSPYFGDLYDCSQLTSFKYMFNQNLTTSIDLSFLGDTSNVTNMSCMFNGCSSLASLDLSNFDTSNVTNMNCMFSDCSGLTSLDVSHLDTSKVTTMDSMFSYCLGLTSLDVSHLDTSNVTIMWEMFCYCSSLTSLDLSNFDTSNVTGMSSMFYGCSSLTTLDLSNFDTSNVTGMSSMFSECSALTKIYCKQAFKDWCIANASEIGLNDTMINGTVGNANAEGANFNWMIVDYTE